MAGNQGNNGPGPQQPQMGGIPQGLLGVDGQPDQQKIAQLPVQRCDKCDAETTIVGMQVRKLSSFHPANTAAKEMAIVVQVPVCVKCLVIEGIEAYFKKQTKV